MRTRLSAIRLLCGADIAVSLIWANPSASRALIAAAAPPLEGTPSVRLSRPKGSTGLSIERGEQGSRVPAAIRVQMATVPAVWLLLAVGENAGLLLGWAASAGLPSWLDSPPNTLATALREIMGNVQTSLVTNHLATRLAAIMAAVPQGILLIDDDGGPALVNKPAAALLGLSDGEVDPVQLRAGFQALLARVEPKEDVADPDLLSASKRSTVDWLWELPGPSPKAYRVTMMPLSDGKLRGRLWVFDDVTKLMQSERDVVQRNTTLFALNEELRQARRMADSANAAKSQFLASMSHEIRTPMTAVLGMADLLASDGLRPTHRRYVETIQKSGSHLLNIINDILDFSRIEAGRLELEEVDFQPLDVLAQVQQLLNHQANERGLQLRIEATMLASLVVRSDPTRLQQVLVNLTGNALKFTTEGEVVVSLKEQPAETDRTLLRFEVRDTGVGIPPEQQSELFQEFTQADQSISRHYGGSGLGLAICRRLVNAMGGQIGVISEPGHGSVFWFELPLPLGDPRSLVSLTATTPDRMRPLHLLVVDDVAINRELLAEMLHRHGHSVGQAGDGRTAVDLARSGDFDAILMDIQMPVMDGIEATRQIRAMEAPASEVPIFALTANVLEREQARYIAAGMNSCLTKPVVWNELFRALAGVARHGNNPEVNPAQPPEPPPKDHAGGSELELLDSERLAGLEAMAGPARLATFVGNAFTSAEHLYAEIARLQDDRPDIAKLAHRLAGTAPSFGLTRIGAVARRLEHQASATDEIDPTVAQLAQAIEATRKELTSRGLLAVTDRPKD